MMIRYVVFIFLACGLGAALVTRNQAINTTLSDVKAKNDVERITFEKDLG